MKKAANPDDLLNTEIKIVDEVALSFVARVYVPISKIFHCSMFGIAPRDSHVSSHFLFFYRVTQARTKFQVVALPTVLVNSLSTILCSLFLLAELSYFVADFQRVC